MGLVTRIMNLVDKNHLNGKEFGAILGLKKSPLTDWKNGKSKPTVTQLESICEYFAVSSDYLLFGKENILNIEDAKLLNSFNQLKEWQKQRILGRIELYEEENAISSGAASNIDSSERNKVIPILGCTAAGQPIDLAEDVYAYSDLVPTKSSKSDFALTVKGNSMEPDILNGSVIEIIKTPSIENGSVAVVSIDGQVTCKRFYKYKDKIELISTNPSYQPIIINARDNKDIKIIGKVIQ